MNSWHLPLDVILFILDSITNDESWKKTELVKLREVCRAFDDAMLGRLAGKNSGLLHAAVVFDQLPLLERLKSDDVNHWGKDSRTPLGLAAEAANVPMILKLLDLGAGIDRSDNGGSVWGSDHGGPAIVNAARKGLTEIVQLLIDKGANPLLPEYSNSWSAIHTACAHGHLAVVQVLVDGGVSPDHIYDCEDGAESPLNIAAASGHANVARFLVERGACLEPDYGKNGNHSALEMIVCRSAPDFIELLQFVLNRKPNLESRNTYGHTPLTRAALYGNVKAVQMLLDHGASIHVQDSLGMNQLQGAIYASSPETVRLLLANGALVNWRGKHVGTPLHAALHGRLRTECEWLCGGGPRAGAIGGLWSWSRCPRPFNVEIVRILVEHGADITVLEQVEQDEVRRMLTSDEPPSEEKERLLMEAKDRLSGRAAARAKYPPRPWDSDFEEMKEPEEGKPQEEGEEEDKVDKEGEEEKKQEENKGEEDVKVKGEEVKEQVNEEVTRSKRMIMKVMMKIKSSIHLR